MFRLLQTAWFLDTLQPTTIGVSGIVLMPRLTRNQVRSPTNTMRLMSYRCYFNQASVCIRRIAMLMEPDIVSLSFVGLLVLHIFL